MATFKDAAMQGLESISDIGKWVVAHPIESAAIIGGTIAAVKGGKKAIQNKQVTPKKTVTKSGQYNKQYLDYQKVEAQRRHELAVAKQQAKGRNSTIKTIGAGVGGAAVTGLLDRDDTNKKYSIILPETFRGTL